MDKHTACELAYKNGLETGLAHSDTAMATRICVAYEQLAKCHDSLCRTLYRNDDDSLVYDLQDVMTKLLDIQVKLGAMKREADL
jgi:hypothetical protein